MLTVQLSCNYVHGYVHFCILFELCFTNLAMKWLVFLVEHGPKVWNSVIRLCIF